MDTLIHLAGTILHRRIPVPSIWTRDLELKHDLHTRCFVRLKGLGQPIENGLDRQAPSGFRCLRLWTKGIHHGT